MATGETLEPTNGSTSADGRAPVSPEEAEAAYTELSSRIRPLLDKLEALGQDTLELVDLQIDRARAGVRRGGERVVIGVWVGLVGMAVSIMASILLVRGLAGGLAELFGDRVWLGELGAALLVIAGCAITLVVWRSRRTHNALARQRLKHEPRSDGEAPDATPHD